MSRIKHWIGRDFAHNILSDGLKSLKETCNHLLNNQTKEYSTPNTPHSALSIISDDRFFPNFFRSEFEPTDNSEAYLQSIEIQLEEELRIFRSLVTNTDFIKTISSNHKFWSSYSDKLLLLRKLYSVLLNISSSSAFIERFFSICGGICTQRRGRSDPDLIRFRCILKANLKLLQELKHDE